MRFNASHRAKKPRALFVGGDARDLKLGVRERAIKTRRRPAARLPRAASRAGP